MRTRDHSHVELLLREGLITAEQAVNHPMRNFVECCIGGDPILPDMTLSGRRELQPDDVLLVCTDGMWATLRDEEIANRFTVGGHAVRDTLERARPARRRARGRRQRQHVRRGPALAGRVSVPPPSRAGFDHRENHMSRPSGRAPDQLRPVRFSRGFAKHARRFRARASSAIRTCCARRASKRRSRRFCAARSRAGSRPSTACCLAPRTRASRARPRRASRPVARRRSSGSSGARCAR